MWFSKLLFILKKHVFFGVGKGRMETKKGGYLAASVMVNRIIEYG